MSKETPADDPRQKTDEGTPRFNNFECRRAK